MKRCGCGAGAARSTRPSSRPRRQRRRAGGPGVRASAVYLMHRQHIPIARCAELLSDVLGAPVSTGFLAGLGPEAAGRLDGFMTRVKAMLGLAPVVHADETTLRVTAESWWLHVVASETLTFLGLHQRRGREAIDDLGVLPGYGGVVVHDGLAAYDYLDRAFAPACGAHLVRHLAKAMEHPDTNLWARLMTGVLLDAVAAHHWAADNGKTKVPATPRPPVSAAATGTPCHSRSGSCRPGPHPAGGTPAAGRPTSGTHGTSPSGSETDKPMFSGSSPTPASAQEQRPREAAPASQAPRQDIGNLPQPGPRQSVRHDPVLHPDRSQTRQEPARRPHPTLHDRRLATTRPDTRLTAQPQQRQRREWLRQDGPAGRRGGGPRRSGAPGVRCGEERGSDPGFGGRQAQRAV